MYEPTWILDKAVEAIHLRQIAEHGGSPGIRDKGLLSSALARPKNLFAYGNPKPDIALLAASYAFGIIKNHPFIDGNKRTAYVVCLTFLSRNRNSLTATEADKYIAFLSVAEGSMGEEELAAWIRSKLIEIPPSTHSQ
jgi:death on curing protein